MEWNGNALEIFKTTMLRHRGLVSGLGILRHNGVSNTSIPCPPVCACPFSIAMQLRIALTLTTPICIHLLYSVKLGQPRSVKAFPTLSAPRPIISPLRDKSITKKKSIFPFFPYESLRTFHKNQFYITLKFESYNEDWKVLEVEDLSRRIAEI